MSLIQVRGLCLHNLKSIDLDLPIGRLIVVNGPSGAGKSTLAFDTLYAEAQRRYVETFSPYARQFLERLPRPPAASIGNLPAAVAIAQSNPVRSARSTVGTLADITHSAQFLYFRAARLICPGCGRPVVDQSPADVASRLAVVPRDSGSREAVLMTTRVSADRVRDLIGQGYFRAFIEDRVCELSGEGWGKDRGETVELVVDRISPAGLEPQRVRESAEQAFALGGGRLRLHMPGGESIDFSKGRHCPACDRNFPVPTPGLFSFNSPTGACPGCQGFGRVLSVDWDVVVPDKSRSIRAGAIRPLENWQDEKVQLMEWCRIKGVDPDSAWGNLPGKIRDAILFGGDGWPGVKSFFDYLESKRYRPHIRMLLARYRAYLRCPDCKGGRFREETGWYRLAGMTLQGFYAMPLKEALAWVRRLDQAVARDAAGAHLVEDVKGRVSTLCAAGLGYLSMDRQSRTLSGGEVARVALARALGTRLSQTLYVLDEPTAGLHPVDTARLLHLLEGLKDDGNTVLVVDHDPQVGRAADVVVELGPGSGEQGGRVVYVGPPRPASPGGQDAGHPIPTATEGKDLRLNRYRCLVVRGVRANNLKDLTVPLPLGAFTCVTGVSGSGKSTLIEHVLYRGLLRRKGLQTEPPGDFDRMEGAELIGNIHFVDQSPLGRTPRACPASYLHVLDGIRRLIAATPEAVRLDLSPGAFSYNTPGGRCEACKGQGSEVVEMQFLPNLTLPCPVCKGKRFDADVLSVRYGGKNIAGLLDMTLDDAALFFKDHAAILRGMTSALRLGLGYLRLGQPINTLSGGEAQRLKLARHLSGEEVSPGLFLLDEPTRGLHRGEVERLLGGITHLTAGGHTVVVVEHDLQVIAAADRVIDLGPGGGDEGGTIVYQGPPAGLRACAESITGSVLRGLDAVEGERGVPAATALPVEGAGGRRGSSTDPGFIKVKGVRHHNLKDLDIAIPKGKLVVVTGVSGSGKSSLAFDLIFSEGQRRYVEGLSSYMRQFIRLYERPDFDRITGLTPTVAIEQRTSRGGPQSTVATLTEVAHYLRLLYARVARPVCPSCNRPLDARGRGEIAEAVLDRWGGQVITILAPRLRRRKGLHQSVLEAALKAGVTRVRINGRFHSIPPLPPLSRYSEHTVEWVYGPVTADPFSPGVLGGLLETALAVGRGEIAVLDAGGEEVHYSERYMCPDCGFGLPDPDPLLFSFHTRAGRCPVCQGLGDGPDGGLCTDCAGSRLNAEARAWRLAGVGIDGLFAMEVKDALRLLEGWLKLIPWSSSLESVAAPLAESVVERLRFLGEVGLGYLPLDRSGETLSGGEAQRIRLAAQVGSGLTGLTVVLDEPTIGLHAQDNDRLLNAMRRLRDGGNTVIVVEHDESTLLAADWVIDLGPGGGRDGGRIVAQGTIDDIRNAPGSVTGLALQDTSRHRIRPCSREVDISRTLEIKGIRRNNIRGMDLFLPLGTMICITGVSGSGKSTLLSEVLHPNVEARIRSPDAPPVFCDGLSGPEHLARCAVVDHSPIGRTPRSCAATYVGILNEIRHLMSRVPAARSRGYGPARFSFNVKGGRCEACGGQGSRKISLGFLPDVYVTCEECEGRRFDPSTLEIEWRGRDIAGILDMTMEEAWEFFSPVPALARPLSVLCELGLGYLTMGQPAPTLSGGEAQRLKIARELVRRGNAETLYLLDEPTTGLHMADVSRLVEHLHKLVRQGNTVAVIEHNLDVISKADWIVDLGPGGGNRGGRLLYAGTPGDFLVSEVESATREALLTYLGMH